jgi:hypothetical protein
MSDKRTDGPARQKEDPEGGVPWRLRKGDISRKGLGQPCPMPSREVGKPFQPGKQHVGRVEGKTEPCEFEELGEVAEESRSDGVKPVSELRATAWAGTAKGRSYLNSNLAQTLLLLVSCVAGRKDLGPVSPVLNLSLQDQGRWPHIPGLMGCPADSLTDFLPLEVSPKAGTNYDSSPNSVSMMLDPGDTALGP